MSAEETKDKKRGIGEENTGNETMGADDGMMKPQLPFSQISFLAEKGNHKKRAKTLPNLQLQDETQAMTEEKQLFTQSVPVLPCFAPVCRARVPGEKVFGSLEGRTQTVDQVMKALADPNTQMMGLHSSNENAIKITAGTPPETVRRRVERDNMFDVILKANVTKKPNLKKIQDEIAGGLGLKLDEKSLSKRASLLLDRIKMKQKILVMLCEVYKGIDLGKVGIPYGADHSGCKILVTSTSEDVLSNQMHTQKNFSV